MRTHTSKNIQITNRLKTSEEVSNGIFPRFFTIPDISRLQLIPHTQRASIVALSISYPILSGVGVVEDMQVTFILKCRNQYYPAWSGRGMQVILMVSFYSAHKYIAQFNTKNLFCKGGITISTYRCLNYHVCFK